MCRLFGLTAGRQRVSAAFWLLDAPDSLAAQSRRNVDGAGIGFFDAAGTPVIDKQPVAAYEDPEFSREAKQVTAATFVAHVRWATAGGRTERNTHPFAMRGRIMAHNGGFGELGRLDERLGRYRELVLGDTDSERYFALITQQIDACGGDVAAGLTTAARWIAQHLPVTSLNTIVAAPGELWALRYPAQHALHMLPRPGGSPGLHVRSDTSSVHAPGLRDAPSVLIASEELDGEDGWQMLAPGELVHVRADLMVDRTVAIPEPPARLVPLPAQNPNIDT
jgi:predicted glutamine amidotransferase